MIFIQLLRIQAPCLSAFACCLWWRPGLRREQPSAWTMPIGRQRLLLGLSVGPCVCFCSSALDANLNTFLSNCASGEAFWKLLWSLLQQFGSISCAFGTISGAIWIAFEFDFLLEPCVGNFGNYSVHQQPFVATCCFILVSCSQQCCFLYHHGIFVLRTYTMFDKFRDRFETLLAHFGHDCR